MKHSGIWDNLLNKACFAWELPPSASVTQQESDYIAPTLWSKHDQSSPRSILNLSP